MDHVDNAEDCCDIDGTVHPGVVEYFGDPYTCGYGTPSWDYNCDGEEELRYDAFGTCTYDPITGDCAMTEGWVGSSGGTMPGCGVFGSWLGGCTFDGSTGTCEPGAASSRMQTCR